MQVTDPTSTGAQARGKQQLKPEGIWYTPVTGIWQTVWLEPVPALHIADVRVAPDIDAGTLRVDVALNRSAADTDAIRLTARANGRVIASRIVRANRSAVLPIPHAHLWSPTWVVNNEGWGQYASTRLAHMVHDLDPSRVVDKASGWLDTGDGGADLYDIHTYEETPRAPVAQGSRAIVIGEFGGIGLPIDGHLWFPARRSWGYQTARDATDYAARYRRKYAEIIRQARVKGLSAAVYTQTSDVEGEVNGLLTYDRERSKLPVEQFARIHAPLGR